MWAPTLAHLSLQTHISSCCGVEGTPPPPPSPYIMEIKPVDVGRSGEEVNVDRWNRVLDGRIELQRKKWDVEKSRA